MIRACEHFSPNGLVRRQIRETQARYLRNFGPPNPSQEAMSYYVLAKAAQAKLRGAIDPWNRHPKEEPFKIYLYPKNGEKQGEPPYKVLYPVEDQSYEQDRDFRALKEKAMASVLGWVDGRWGGPESIEGAQTSFRLRVLAV